jgi:putative transposase
MKFCASFRSVLAAGGVKAIPLPARSPNSNVFAKRWVRSAKQECLSRLILCSERPLSRASAEFSAHYHGERNHQGRGNQLLFLEADHKPKQRGRTVECHHRSEVY